MPRRHAQMKDMADSAAEVLQRIQFPEMVPPARASENHDPEEGFLPGMDPNVFLTDHDRRLYEETRRAVNSLPDPEPEVILPPTPEFMDLTEVFQTPPPSPQKKVEFTGGSVDYYQVQVRNPTTPGREPYLAECNDIIEALGMNFAEGNAFKAIWRTCASRNLGKSKDVKQDGGVYDAEKVIFFGQRMLAMARGD